MKSKTLTKNGIVIFENQTGELNFLSGFLEEEGYTHFSLVKVSEALEELEKKTPSLIFLSLETDIAEGLNTYRQLKNHPSTKNTRFIITLNPEDHSILDKISDGTTDFLFTPMRKVDVLARIKMQILLYENRKAEDAHMERDRRFRSIFEYSPVGKSMTSIDGKLDVNEAFCNMLGYTEDELKNKHWTEISHPDDEQLTQMVVNDLLSGKSDRSRFEKRYIHKNGSLIWADVSTFLQRDDEGNPQYFITSVNNITRQKEIEDELRESEYFFRESQKAASIGSFKYDFRMQTWQSSEVLDGILGLEAKDARSYDEWVEQIHPDDREMMNRYFIEEIVQKHLPFNKEYRIVRKLDGEIRFVHGMAGSFYDQDGNITSIIGTIQDVTERKKLEQEQFQMLNIIENSLNEIYVFDIETLQFEHLNAGALKNIGYSSDEIKLLTPVDIKPEFTETTFRKAIDPLLSGKEKKLVFETYHRRKNGTDYPVEVHLQLDKSGGKASFFAIINDITERKQTEQRLQDTLRKLQFHIENTPLAEIEFNKDYQITKWSGNAEKMFGWTSAEVIGKKIGDFKWVIEEDVQKVDELSNQMHYGNEASNLNVNRNYTKKGEILTCEWYNSALYDSNGELSSVHSLVHDITPKVLAEEQVKRNERKFRALIENSFDGITLIDAHGIEIYHSNSAYRILGYAPNENIGNSIFDLVHPEDQKIGESLLKRVHLDNQIISFSPVRILHRDGHWLWIEGTATNLLEDPLIQAVVVNYRDITERKRSDEKLIQSEEKFRKLAESTPIAISIYQDDHWVYANPASEKLSGYRFEEFSQQKVWDFVAPEFQEMVRNNKKTRLAGHGPEHGYEFRIIRKNGESRWVYLKGSLVNYNGRPAGLISVLDLTDKKKMEDELLQREYQYRTLFEQASDGIFLTDPQGNYIDVNSAGCNMVGYTRDEILQMNIKDLVGEVGVAQKPIQFKELRENPQVLAERQLICKSGKIIQVEISGKMLNDGRLQGIVRDITQRKIIEEQLKESEERYNAFINADIDMIFVKDDQFRYVMANNAMAAFFAKLPAELIGKSDEELAHNSKILPCKSSDQRALNEQNAFTIEEKLGNRIYETTKFALSLKDQKKGIGGIIRDITERKEAEAAILEANQKMDAFFNQSLDGFFFMMLDQPIAWNDNADKDQLLEYAFSKQHITKINQAMLDQYGATEKDFISLTPSDLFSHNIEHGKAEWRKLFDKGKLHTVTDERKLNGEPIFIEGDYICLYDQEGRITGHFGIQRDITDAKLAEIALKESEKKFKTLVESSADGISLLDLEGTILFANARKAEMIGVKSHTDLIGLNAYSLIAPKYHAKFRDSQNDFMASGQLRNIETEIVRRDGSTFWAEMNISLVTDNQGNPAYIMDSIRDISERKKSEEQLLQSEKELKHAQKVAHVGNWVWNIKTNKLTWSDEMYRIFGVDKEAFSGDLSEIIQKRIHTDDREMVNSRNLSVINHANPIPLEYRVVHEDGTIRVVWAEAGEIEIDENDRAAYLHGIVQDITEQKQAMAAIESERKLLRTLIDNLPDSVFIKDAHCRKVAANLTDVERMGVATEAEAIGKTDIELYEGEIGQIGYNDDLKVIQTGVPMINKEQFFVDKSGGIRWSLVSKIPLADSNGTIYGLVGIGRDITERKKAEEQINKLTKSIEQSPSTIVITDVNGKIEYVNPKFCEITGYSPEEAIGQNPRILKSGKMQDDVYTELWNRLLAGDVWRGEFLNRKKNGELYWEWATMTSIKNESGVITNFIAIKEDISLRKKMEADLILAKEKAEESDRLKSAFLANMSHEIRTPLNSIIGFSELLADEDFTSNQKKDFVNNIIANGNNLLNIISDIIDISKIEAGEITIRFRSFSVLHFLKELISIHKRKVETKNLVFETAISIKITDETNLVNDTDRLHQIFNNLISNSLKFTEHGFIEIGASLYGQSVTFYVKDSGIGIPPEFHEKIFHRFRQVEFSYTRRYGGNGLGLAITKNLVELMGGKIWVESEYGNGTTFFIELPMKSQ